MDDEVRKQHELHVSGLEGGSILTMIGLSLVPCSLLLFYSSLSHTFTTFQILSSSSSLSFSRKFLKEWTIRSWFLLFPLVLGFTIWSNISLYFFLSIAFFSILLFKIYPPSSSSSPSSSPSPDSPSSFRPFFLTWTNIGVVMITILSILAVDFHVYPRDFVKRETFGFALMDLGVGSYVFKGGFLFSRRYSTITTNNDPKNKKKTPKQQTLHHLFFDSLPLLILGLLRFLSLSSTNYQQHTTEYGIHFNFFIILFFLRVFTTLLTAFLPPSPLLHLFLSFFFLSLQQFLLSAGGMTEYLVDNSNRFSSFFSMNKEGFCSLPGYFSLVCFSIYLGLLFFRSSFWKHPSPSSLRSPPFLTWMALSLLFWFLCFISHTFLQPTSRRFVNAPYVLLILAFSSTSLLASFTTQSLFLTPLCSLPSSPSFLPSDPFVNALNDHGLVLFLVGNLLTGAVNLSMNTLEVGDVAAVGVLLLYMELVSLSSVVVGGRGEKKKS